MKLKIILCFVSYIIICCIYYIGFMDEDLRRLITNIPTNRNVLFWSVEQRDAAFIAVDKIPFILETRTIKAGEKCYHLIDGNQLDLKLDVDKYMDTQRAAGLIVIHKNEIRLEKYGLHLTPEKTWTSFSVAKSITSTLVGAAIKDGYINSINDNISDYIPDLKYSVYDGVTIKQLLTMSTGVEWNEDYTDANSDVSLFDLHKPEDGVDITVSYMRNLHRKSKPGTEWNYNTGETNLVGVLISSATGKTLSEYLSEKYGNLFGMESDASWLLGITGHEISGACIQATLRDFARFGLFTLSENSILPDNWMSDATKNHFKVDNKYSPCNNYGYQWWVIGNDCYMAAGIFGQSIFIDKKRELVIASNCNWDNAIDLDKANQRFEFFKHVQNAIDIENQ